MSTYKNVQAFSTLEKTEMGIYGLLSANGLSEYTTGKDMFGNELTAEQRQASLTQSIFAGLPFVPGMAKEAGKLGQQALNSTVQIGKQGADVSRAFMDDLGRSLNTGPNVAFAGGVGDVSSYLKAESRADGVGKVSGDKESYLSMLSGGSGDVVKGTGKEYKNYKAVEYTGTTKVNGDERDISRRVFQRIDIDYKRIDPDTGMTNFQLMKKGRAPIWKDGTVIELHHLIQREPGSMVEIPASMHDEYSEILHGLVENGGSFRNDPVLKRQYDNFRSKYWRWRAKQIDKSEL
ncbi:HNH/ENDO VII family nuclease [Niallia taxi]|uniref:HNH/ENDO VII family nuclease n=1 Tax=Niallia taxi TaxID=2499688 RepID=UPI00300A6979